TTMPSTQRVNTSMARVRYGRPMGWRSRSSTTIRSMTVWSICTCSIGSVTGGGCITDALQSTGRVFAATTADGLDGIQVSESRGDRVVCRYGQILFFACSGNVAIDSRHARLLPLLETLMQH